MSTYTPDAWVMLEFNSTEYGNVRKILAGWYGGYCGSDSWKLSSGNLPEYIENGFVVFPQESGSVYYCDLNSQKLTGYTASILETIKRTFKDNSGVSVNLIRYEV